MLSDNLSFTMLENSKVSAKFGRNYWEMSTVSADTSAGSLLQIQCMNPYSSETLALYKTFIYILKQIYTSCSQMS